MTQEAAPTACRLVNILQMHKRGPEKTTQRTGKSHWVTSTDLVIPFISLWVTSAKSSVSFPEMCLLSRSSFPHLFPHSSTTPSFACSACGGGSGFEAEGFWGMQGLALGLEPVCTPVISTVWSLCFPREASGLPAYPPVLYLKHTRTHRCTLDVNLCESSVLAGGQSHHCIRWSELYIPKWTTKSGNTTQNLKSRSWWQLLKIEDWSVGSLWTVGKLFRVCVCVGVWLKQPEDILFF